jgi:hypothetical protein
MKRPKRPKQAPRPIREDQIKQVSGGETSVWVNPLHQPNG